jgi:hypothetical protein
MIILAFCLLMAQKWHRNEVVFLWRSVNVLI